MKVIKPTTVTKVIYTNTINFQKQKKYHVHSGNRTLSNPLHSQTTRSHSLEISDAPLALPVSIARGFWSPRASHLPRAWVNIVRECL